MIDSFFVPSFGNRPGFLVGRDDIRKFFAESLKAPIGSRERSLLLLGQRGLGKTVLLLEYADIARELGYIVASPTVVKRGMNERILEKIESESENIIKVERKKVSGGSVSALGFAVGIQMQEPKIREKSFAFRLSKICGELNKNGKGLLILVDEVQANNEDLKELVIAYQEIVGEGRDIAIAFAGIPMAISALLNEHVLTFLNRAKKIELSPLNTNEIVAYYGKAFARTGVHISDNLIQKAAKETSGSPYLMQLIGHYIVVFSEGAMTEREFSKAVDAAKADFKEDICQTTLASLSSKDIEFLHAIAKQGQEARISDIASSLKKDDAYTQTYKRRLIQTGVISQPKRGIVKIEIPYLCDYLRETLD